MYTTNGFCFNVLDSEDEENISSVTFEDPDMSAERGIPRKNITFSKHAREKNSGTLPISEDDWTEVDMFPTIDVFCGNSGITDIPNLDEDSSVSDFFSYFIDSDLLKLFKQQTNLYARQKLIKLRSLGKLSPTTRMSEWKPVTVGEIKKFLAIIFHMSIDQKPQIQDHWSKNPVVSCNFCPNLMGRNRFLLIMSNFHLNDNSYIPRKGQPGYDPLYKLRPLLDILCVRFQQAYQPAEDITIDEGMCKYRGRLAFKQYMPQKPSKYGIKLYMLSESKTGYIWNFSVFCGQSNVVVDVTKNLLGSLVGKGHTLYTDRYYTSPTLASLLEKEQTALVGTVMKNRKGMPAALKQPNLQKGEHLFRRKGNLLALCWRDKREVYMLSTRHSADMVTYVDKRGREKRKPACVINYNNNKFGVDLSDQRMSYGAFEHRSVKWWRKLSFHTFLMCLVNACILYNQVKRKKISLSQFIKDLCQDLPVSEGETLQTSASGSQLSRLENGKHFLERIPRPEGKKKLQRMCKICSDKGRKHTGKAVRKDTSYQCSACKIPMCREPCFKIYH